MSGDIFPHEIKILIYGYVDLQTFKCLRQASNSWALVGLELLLLPSFFINSHSVGVERLIEIGTSPSVSRQAATKVKKLVFQTTGWDPRYFRNIVCSRHEHRSNYETLDFVPTQAEQEALEELDTITAQIELEDLEDLEHGDRRLTSALRQTPLVNAIEIVVRNPFNNRILRKVWEEYAMEAYPHIRIHSNQLWRILCTANKAGLTIQHLRHDQLFSRAFVDFYQQSWDGMIPTLRSLRSLKLVISDIKGEFQINQTPAMHLRSLLALCSALESLAIFFETLGRVPIDFLPAVASGKLHTITLSATALDTFQFTAFLGCHASTLKRLRLQASEIEGGSWREFLEVIKARFGGTLEKFQLTGMIRSSDSEDEWMLFPMYDREWNMMDGQRMQTTREMEDFVLRDGSWPLTAANVFNVMTYA